MLKPLRVLIVSALLTCAVIPTLADDPFLDVSADAVTFQQINGSWHVIGTYSVIADENVTNFSYEGTIKHYRSGVLLNELTIPEVSSVMATNCISTGNCEAQSGCQVIQGGKIHYGSCVDHPKDAGKCVCSLDEDKGGGIIGGQTGDIFTLNLAITSGPLDSDLTNNSTSATF